MAKVVFLDKEQAMMLSDIFDSEGAVVLVWPEVVTPAEGEKLVELADSGDWYFDDPDVLIETVYDRRHAFAMAAIEPLWATPPAQEQSIFDNVRK